MRLVALQHALQENTMTFCQLFKHKTEKQQNVILLWDFPAYFKVESVVLPYYIT